MCATLEPMLQGTLFAAGAEVALRPVAQSMARSALGARERAWLDVRTGWVPGAGGSLRLDGAAGDV
jgi:hypothetical protein